MSSDGYRFTDDPPWTRVEGGDLPVPVAIVFGQSRDGRYKILELSLGDGDEEITSATLRQIRLSEIRAAYADWHGAMRQLCDLAAAMSQPLPRAGRGKPDADTLRSFAQTYQAELSREPHRAMTAAARAHNISRATANRWAALCRELNYLPSSTGEESTS